MTLLKHYKVIFQPYRKNDKLRLKTDMDIKHLTYDTGLETLSDQNSDLRNQIDMVMDRCNDIISKTLDESHNSSVGRNDINLDMLI